MGESLILHGQLQIPSDVKVKRRNLGLQNLKWREANIACIPKNVVTVGVAIEE